MGERLRLALVGCGQIAELHARRLVDDGRAEVVVVSDPLAENSRRIREKYFPAAVETTDYREAWSLEGLAGVIVATPTHLHAEQAAAALERGVAVLCEKPLAETREKLIRLIELSEMPGMPPLVLGYQRRFSAVYRTLKREIDSGQYGKILAISQQNSEHWMQDQAIPGSWRNDPCQNPGEFIGDAGSHKIDLLFYLTGMRVTEVFGQINPCGTPIPIRGSFIARLEGGVDLSANFLGDAHHFREDLHIVLERADLVLRDREIWRACRNELHLIEDLETDSDSTRGFLDVLQGKLQNPAPARCALDVYDFTMAILDSSKQGVRVCLD